MNRKYILVFFIVILFTVVIACSKPNETPPDSPPDSETETETETVPIMSYRNVSEGYSPLTGLPYNGDGKAIMVQIENTPLARPQSGITKADLIYEMEVEGKITRITAFFLSKLPEKVGPVRSARKQHMLLWSEWDYLYTFFGGSEYEPGQNIYSLIDEMGLSAPRVDGYKGGKSFTRSKDRKAPHNAYTDLTYTMKNSYDYEPKQRTLFFNDKASIKGPTAIEISFSYNSNNNIKYVFDSEASMYNRFIDEKPMIDKENQKQLTVKNIIIQHSNHYKVTDTVYTNIDLVGSGKAEYFTDGIMRTGTWERKNLDSLTIYYDDKGVEIPFKPGVTFIQIVRSNTPIVVN